ncbi:MAG: YtxH domain-containing protein [Armatimonadota bacterium]|nr:YtxH domain-containing protein [Armatimonadota bacterium]
MKRLVFFLYGLMAGAAAGIILAPQSGRATRGLIRDKSMKYSMDVADYTTGKAKHIANKTRGYAHTVREALVRGEEKVKTYI